MADLDAIRERDREWGAETPGGEPWPRKKVGEAYFQAGYDRHTLLAIVDGLPPDLRALLVKALASEETE